MHIFKYIFTLFIIISVNFGSQVKAEKTFLTCHIWLLHQDKPFEQQVGIIWIDPETKTTSISGAGYNTQVTFTDDIVQFTSPIKDTVFNTNMFINRYSLVLYGSFPSQRGICKLGVDRSFGASEQKQF